MTENDFIISTMQWSFSRLNSFYHCPYEWKRIYIDCEPKEGGFFSEFGSFCHSLLERYLKNEISIFEISQKYEEEFDTAIPHEAPPNKNTDLRQLYFDKGLEYFNNLDMNLNQYEILGVEKEVNFKIADKDFVGYIDLLLRNKQTAEITILDHKSGSLKLKKDGSVSQSDEAHFLEFKRQLYLYSIPIIKEYGKVDYLKWNLFKDHTEYQIPWNRSEYEEAVKWAETTLFLISVEEKFNPNPDFFYCHYLCSQRNNCCEFKP